MSDGAAWLFIPLQILFVDLLLGADNAVVIALACRSLPPSETGKAIAFSTAGAIVVRLILTTFANAMLAIPLVRLIGAGTLIVIALNLRVDPAAAAAVSRRAAASGDFFFAVLIIAFADAAMSLDNVVALAAIARGNFWLLSVGVAASIPILAYGSLILANLPRRAPLLVTFGAALLGWIAGDLAISDPVVAGWANANAPALVAIAPLLGVAAVLGNMRSGARIPPRPPGPARVVPADPAPPPPVAAAALPAHAALPGSPKRVVVENSARPPNADKTGSPSRRPEERIAVVGAIVLAAIVGLILLFAAFFDVLTLLRR